MLRPTPVTLQILLNVFVFLLHKSSLKNPTLLLELTVLTSNTVPMYWMNKQFEVVSVETPTSRVCTVGEMYFLLDVVWLPELNISS